MALATVAVDLEGGDHGVGLTTLSCLDVLRRDGALELVLLACEEHMKEVRERTRAFAKRLRYLTAPAPKERNLAAVLRQEEGLLHVLMAQLAERRAGAAVSAEDSALLLGVGRQRLGMLEGVERPAICCKFPTERGFCCILDVGACVDIPARRLEQLAVIGSRFARAAGIAPDKAPRCALLSIGSEAGKGNREVREAAGLLEANAGLDYVGLVEGDELFSGKADVIVCDGFAGNIALKTAEGTGRYIISRIKNNALLNMLFSFPFFARLRAGLHPGSYNGACLLGLDGIVVKSHGGAGREGFASAIAEAAHYAQTGLWERLGGAV